MDSIKVNLDPTFVAVESVPEQRVQIEVKEANEEQTSEREVAVGENEKQIEISPEEKDCNH